MRKIKIFLAFLVISICLGVTSVSTEKSESLKGLRAWLEISFNDPYLKIKAYCLNETFKKVTLSYKLKTTKISGSGKSRNLQMGSFELGRREMKCVSQTSLRVLKDDKYKIDFRVYEKGKLLVGDIYGKPRIKN